MTKTEKILACNGHITFNTIHKVVGCTAPLVHSVIKKSDQANFVNPRHTKFKHSRRRTKVDTTQFSPEMKIIINNDDTQIWTIEHVSANYLMISRNAQKKAITYDKVSTIING